MVKSLGDGMLLVFESVPDAALASFAMQSRTAGLNQGHADDDQVRLRIGIHCADVVVDELDIYGAGVNLAARLATLAAGEQIVVSADVHDQLLAGVEAQIEDLGECELRGIEGTVRAYRIEAPGAPAHPQAALDTFGDSRAVIAVLPLGVNAADGEAATLAEIVADDVIRGLSMSSSWRVISRMTTMAFRQRQVELATVASQLKATYVVSGTCMTASGRVRLGIELADVASATVIWAGAVQGAVTDLFQDSNPLAQEIIGHIAAAIFSHEIRRSRAGALPNLRSYTLMFGAVALMHRLSRNDFERSEGMLAQLIERHPGAAEPLAWMAKWHVMKVAQGWSQEPEALARRAHQFTRRALDKQGDHALALAVDGLICAFLQADLDASEQRYQAALTANPNEALAWLFLSALHTYRGRGDAAVDAASTASRLSPLDPMRYFFDAFAANAMLAAGRHAEAIALAERSIRANCTHLPTYRALAIAQVARGEVDHARATVRRLLQVQPSYSVDQFLARYPGRDAAHTPDYVRALRQAGLPQT
jgi:TolB-like protein